MEEALEHPFLAKYHDPSNEPFCLKPFDFSFESTHLSKESLKAAVQVEIDRFKVRACDGRSVVKVIWFHHCIECKMSFNLEMRD